jgi:hypothetical protein
MWPEAERLFGAHRAALAAVGIPLRARLEADRGLLCTYDRGVFRLALPDPSLPGGELRAQLLAALLGLDVEAVVWMFRAQLARLVGHEIGHALRDEHRTMTTAPWLEEQAAERFANVLCRDHISPSTRTALRLLLAGVVARLGGLAEAAALHRNPRARTLPEVRSIPAAVPPSPTLYRDLPTFTRLAVAWGYLDLLLDEEDHLDACRTDLLLVA